GITFKENCPDIRNSKVVDVIWALKEYDANVTIYDPWANPEEVKREYNLDSTTGLPNQKFDAVVLGVAHKEFLALDLDNLQKENGVIYDLKGILEGKVSERL
ncbi:MAG: Vi polysaccharide biosynthesis UDP-N-acetylglucosamine C-6 dehydrogenase TviB, partial [Endomicrobium sp.]|nr:Vi polysaccharide biosynthesis UDP-N-acetylglucosamine C-6 dehydrogenase TviB [Endomicrobium sp.]